MAGTVDIVERVSTGIEMEGDLLSFNPELPPEPERLDMRIHYRGHASRGSHGHHLVGTRADGCGNTDMFVCARHNARASLRYHETVQVGLAALLERSSLADLRVLFWASCGFSKVHQDTPVRTSNLFPPSGEPLLRGSWAGRTFVIDEESED